MNVLEKEGIISILEANIEVLESIIKVNKTQKIFMDGFQQQELKDIIEKNRLIIRSL